MFKSLLYCIAVGLACVPVQAGSLGEAIQAEEQRDAETVPDVGSVKVSGMLYRLQRVTLAKELYLPDAVSPRRIEPRDGRILVLVEGVAVNQGAEEKSFEIPKLVASNGGKNSPVENLYYKRCGSTLLNPMECYPFVVCYLVSPSLLVKSTLEVSDGEWINPCIREVPLPMKDTTLVQDEHILPGVTDNMFDVTKVPNTVDPSASEQVERAKAEAEARKRREERERAESERRMKMLEWELESNLRSLESELRSL